MDFDPGSLFSSKELFQMAHDAKGYSYYLKSIPTTKRRKLMDENMHLLEGMAFEKDFPIIRPYNGTTDLTPVAYTEKSNNPKGNEILHFFLDDYRFRNAVWNNLDATTYRISVYDYVFTPDFSLWRNVPTEYFNKANIFKTRFVGAYWQQCGMNVIPTASWGGLESFNYCFCGLPFDSVVAVSAMGARRDTDSFNLWLYGVSRLVDERRPTEILIYGEEFEVPGIDVSVKFLPTYVSKHFRNGNFNK